MCNAISLVLERYIYDLLISLLERNSLLNPQQHGCRWGVSTVTNLLLALDSVFRKNDLIYKQRQCGVGGECLMWTASWLVFRKQRNKIDRAFSDWDDVTSLK
eukprot:GHVN01106522.1.p2 GENE.GHVN01106522.1~~GHVN01106522.1.p2  ORF type:complete len:102 (-),score=17.50 GHVN01106522.1:90-395(-)